MERSLSIRVGSRFTAKEAGGEDDQAIVAVAPNESARVLAVEVKEKRKRSRRHGSPKRPCSRPWKAPENWSRTKSCAKAMRERGPRHSSDARANHRRSDSRWLHRAQRKRAYRQRQKDWSLITLTCEICIPMFLCTPEMTGEWESRLKQMAHGKTRSTAFSWEDIRGLTRDIVERVRNFPRRDNRGANTPPSTPSVPTAAEAQSRRITRLFRCQKL